VACDELTRTLFFTSRTTPFAEAAVRGESGGCLSHYTIISPKVVIWRVEIQKSQGMGAADGLLLTRIQCQLDFLEFYTPMAAPGRRAIYSLSCLQQLDRVAQLGGALVEFACDRDFHLALHDLELRERTFRADFLEPLFEKGEFGTFRGQLRKI
jgi:hypothetical protein